MTNIVYDERDGCFLLSAEGHAGYAEKGQEDIVCASVSSFVCLYAKLVEEAAKQGKLKEFPVIRLEGGDAFISAQPKPEEYECFRRDFAIVMIGLRMVAEGYSENVKIFRGRGVTF